MQINMEYINLEAKRFNNVKGTINVHNNSNISDISKIDDEVTVSFTFTSVYEPDIGVIKIDGKIRISDANEEIKEAFNKWESSEKKSIPHKLAERLHNTIISNCIIEATLLSREILLPPPIPTPRISTSNKEKTKEKGRENIPNYIR
ncbi:MAG: hypothetical protein DRO92_01565 [Candidatus Altiarchaeales archaeon]|nr:MAG: hypothetical protein DRO92_01565 [Candidatus Altiarchaeales archaeon]